MSPVRTYIDSGVLITAFRGNPERLKRAMQFLDDSDREFASSPFVELEVLPKPYAFSLNREVDFYQSFFSDVKYWAGERLQRSGHVSLIRRITRKSKFHVSFSLNSVDNILLEAFSHAATHGLSAIDALHLAAALSVQADEFVTSEKPSKPLFKTSAIKVTTIALP